MEVYVNRYVSGRYVSGNIAYKPTALTQRLQKRRFPRRRHCPFNLPSDS
jgi:hypothetical protein